MSIANLIPDCPPMLAGTPPKTTADRGGVIFGATGDLTHRKIVPAFYHLAKNGLLPEGSVIIGFARRPKSDDEFRKDLGEGVCGSSHNTKPVDEAVWGENVQAHLLLPGRAVTSPDSYKALAKKLESLPESANIKGNYLFYLATSPEYFGPAAQSLAAAGTDEQGRHEAPPDRGEAVRHGPEEREGAEQDGAGRVCRERYFPHRPLPRQGDGART